MYSPAILVVRHLKSKYQRGFWTLREGSFLAPVSFRWLWAILGSLACGPHGSDLCHVSLSSWTTHIPNVSCVLTVSCHQGLCKVSCFYYITLSGYKHFIDFSKTLLSSWVDVAGSNSRFESKDCVQTTKTKSSLSGSLLYRLAFTGRC